MNGIRALGKHNCPLFLPNLEKWSPFLIAVWYGYSDLCVYLISMGAQLTDPEVKETNAVQLAARRGHVNLLRVLPMETQVSSDEIAALLRRKDNYGNDALCASIQSDNACPKIIAELIELGAAPAREDGTDGTALILAIQNNRTEIARVLLEHGADPNATGSAGVTPLFTAFERGDLGIAETLIAAGASPFALTSDKMSILRWLRKQDKKGAVRVIVNSLQFQREFPADEEWTPLMYAAFLGEHDLIARELARPDPRVGHVARDGSSAPALMVSNDLAERVGELIRRGVFDPWLRATAPGRSATTIGKRERKISLSCCSTASPRNRGSTRKSTRCRSPSGLPATCATGVGRPSLGVGSEGPDCVGRDNDIGLARSSPPPTGAEEIFEALVSNSKADLQLKDIGAARQSTTLLTQCVRASSDFYTAAMATDEGQGAL